MLIQPVAYGSGRVIVVAPKRNVIDEVIFCARAWGRTMIWKLSNRDRYGNEDGWPGSPSGRYSEPSSHVYSSRERESMQGDALRIHRALQGMPEEAYAVFFSQYVLTKGRRKDGRLYKIPVKTKAADLGMGTTEYYRHLNGAHHYLAGRWELCAQNDE